MKKIILLSLSLFFVSGVFSQIKVLKSTKQKRFGGMGGVVMDYRILYKNKKELIINVDSIRTIADSTKLDFYFDKFANGNFEINFIQGLAMPAKCATCLDTSPKQFDLTKGVIVYYKAGNKCNLFRVQKFKKIPDLMYP